MAKTKAKWILYDANSLEADGDNLRVFLVAAGGLERTASGIQIKTGGVTDGMLAGSISFSKLADNANIARLDQNETIVGQWNFPDGANAPTINSVEIATQAYVDSAVTGLDFQADVLDKQVDGTLDPGATPTTGDRYIVTDTGTLHANFGTITGVGDNDIVEYDGANFVVAYDVSVEGEGAITWNQSANYFERYDGTSWDEFGGLSGVTAGAGLTKTGNTMNVGAGNGIQVNTDDVAVKPDAVGGANLAKVVDANANGVAIKIDDDTIGENGSGQLYVKANSIGANEIDETDTYDFTGGSVDVATQTTGNDTTKAASTAFVQQEIANFSVENKKVYAHVITAGEVTAGYFSLPTSPVNAQGVTASVHEGIDQLNKQVVGATGATPDFDVLNTTEFHFNNNGAATGLSEDMGVNDVIIVVYED
jgi:hypothetical protein